MNFESNRKSNSEKLRDILKGSNKGDDYTESQLLVLEGAIYGNNPNIVLKITNGNGVYLDGYVSLLRNAFKKVISKAFNEDENNRYKISKLSYEKDELARQKTILSKKINQTSSTSSNENFYKEKISELERELSITKNNYEKLQNKYQKDIAEQDKKIDDLLSKYRMCDAALESYKSAALTLSTDKEQIEKEISGKSVVISELQRQNETLHNRINELSSDKKELEIQVKHYEKLEKILLPFLLADSFCKKYQGKSIELNKSQIEDVIKYYLNGYSQFKISKELNISRSTIKKILTCDFSTLSSIDKILSALHSVNGNWSDERKDKLTVLIKDYEVAKKIIESRKNEMKEDLKIEIASIEDYINFKQQK